MSVSDVFNQKPKRGAKRAIFKKILKHKIAALKLKTKKKKQPVHENLETKTHGLAIAALVCGILGFFTFGILSVLAIVFGNIAIKRINESGGFYTGRGLAVAGLVLGIIVVAIVVLALTVGFLINGF